MERFDFVFSYWLFAWYLLYMFYGSPIPNPKLFLIFGLAYNILMVPLGLVKNVKLFTIINMFIKVLPIWTLLNTRTTPYDVKCGFLLVLMYLIYMIFNKQNILESSKPLTNLLIKESIIK